MQKTIAYQNALLPDLTADFPSTRYQGSKAKLVGWIWAQIADLSFQTCLDAYLRFAEVERSFGNKTTWDRPFAEWFRVFVGEANRAVFDNGQPNRALNLNAVDMPGEYDLVYIDTPYISRRGVAVDYLAFYHFLEGLTMYDEWAGHVDWRSRHRRLRLQASEWTDRKRIHSAFDRLFQRYRESILVVSCRSDGIPSEAELMSILGRCKTHVRVEHFGQYKYVLSTNSESKEILLIGT